MRKLGRSFLLCKFAAQQKNFLSPLQSAGLDPRNYYQYHALDAGQHQQVPLMQSYQYTIQGQPLPGGPVLAAGATQTQAAPGAAPLQLVPPHHYATSYATYGSYYPYYYTAASYHQRAAQHASLYLQQAAAAAAAAQYTGFSYHYLPYLHYQYGSPHTYQYISGIPAYVSSDQVGGPAASPAQQQQFFYGPSQSHNQYLQSQYQFYAQLYQYQYLQYAQKKRKLNTQVSQTAAGAGARSSVTTASTPEAALIHGSYDDYASAAVGPNSTVNEEGHYVYKIPCLSCRRSHSKCDRLLPACTRCIKKGMRCEYPEATTGYKRTLSMYDESSETPSYATSAAATVVSLATTRPPTQLAHYLASVNGRAPAYDAPALRRPASPKSNYLTKALYRLFIRTPGMVTSGSDAPIPLDDVKPPAVVHVSAKIVDFLCNTYYSCIWLSDAFIPRERLRYLLVRYMVWEQELQKAIYDMTATSVLALGQFGQIPCSVIANGVTKPAVLETVNIPGSNTIEVQTSEMEEENGEVTLEEMALLYAVETFALQSAGERALAKHYFMRSKELLDIVWNNTMQSEEYGRLWTKVQLTRQSVLMPSHSLPATLRSPYPSTYYNISSDAAAALSPAVQEGYTSDATVSTPSSTPSTADASELIDLIIESNPANMRLRYVVAGMWLLAFYYLGEGNQRSAYLLHHNVRFYLKYLDDTHVKTAVTLFDRFDGFLDMIGATDRTMRNQMYMKFRATRFPGLANAPYLYPYGGDPGLVAFYLMYSNDAYASRENIEKAILSFDKSFDAYEKMLVGEFFIGNDILTASQTAVIENTLSLVIKGIKLPDLQFMLEKAKERHAAAQQRQHEQYQSASSTYVEYYANDGSSVSTYVAETTISVAEGEQVVEAIWQAIVREADLVSDFIDMPTFPLCPFVSSFGVFAAACVHTQIAKQVLAQGLQQEQLPVGRKSPVELLAKELKALDLLATRYSIIDQLFGQEVAKMNAFVRTLPQAQQASRPSGAVSPLAPLTSG